MPVVADPRDHHHHTHHTQQRVASTWEDWRPALDRCLLISWLLKDLGWMTTNVYLAWPFGFLSICLHFLVLVIDWSSSVANRFYHTSLLLWIIGNFIWMTVEFMVTPQSSSIHLGPETPLGGMTSETGDKITNIKSKLFLIAIFLQLTLFVSIKYGFIAMPNDSDSELGDCDGDVLWEEDDEEMLMRLEEVFYLRQGSDTHSQQHTTQSKNRHRSGSRDGERDVHVTGEAEASKKQHKKLKADDSDDDAMDNIESSQSSQPLSPRSNTTRVHVHGSPTNDVVHRPGKVSRSVSDSSIDDSVLDSFRRFIPTTKKYPLGFSLTFIENGYIILWISKDYFWSWATGDFDISRNAGYFTEFISMFFGVLSVCLYTFVAYAWRGHFVNLMDSLTSWCWLFSNFTWMAGEIFIRYDSMQLNDDNQGDDGFTRLVSGVFFVVGLNIQVCVLCHFVLESRSSTTSGQDYYSTRRKSGSANGNSRGVDQRTINTESLPNKWSNIKIDGGSATGSTSGGSKGESRLPKLSLGFLPKIGSNNHKFVNIQPMDVER